MVDRTEFTPIGKILSAFMDENMTAKAGRVSSFFKSWRHIAGERLCAHSRVAEVDKGIVMVEADHPSWIQLLQMRQEEMLEAIRRGWPELEIKGIAFRLPRSGPAVRRADSPGTDAPPPSDPDASAEGREVPAEGDASAPEAPREPVRDARLSQALERLKKSVADRNKPQKT
jgi:hypothetical protein